MEHAGSSPSDPGRLRVRRGAVGVIENAGRYLMIRRADCVAKGGFWCFPGGHVEPGERTGQTVVRELAEELGIEVRPHHLLGRLRVPDSRHVLDVWLVKHVDRELCPAPGEVAEIRWVTRTEIAAIAPGLPTNEQIVRMLPTQEDTG